MPNQILIAAEWQQKSLKRLIFYWMRCHLLFDYESVAPDVAAVAEDDAFVSNVAGLVAVVEDEADWKSLNELDDSWEFDLH